jgi:WhiB family redox-sensing transcriptional regulator
MTDVIRDNPEYLPIEELLLMRKQALEALGPDRDVYDTWDLASTEQEAAAMPYGFDQVGVDEFTAIVGVFRMAERGWRDRADCTGLPPRTFYPEGDKLKVSRLTAKAKAICENCPVSLPCLEEALELGEIFGIRGGMTEDERLTIRKTNRNIIRMPFSD